MAIGARDLDGIGEVILALGIGVADAAQEPHQIGHAEGQYARITQIDGTLGLGRILVFANGDELIAALRNRRP